MLSSSWFSIVSSSVFIWFLILVIRILIILSARSVDRSSPREVESSVFFCIFLIISGSWGILYGAEFVERECSFR